MNSRKTVQGKNDNKIHIKTIIALAGVFLLVAILVLWLFLPKVANHFNFALPIGNPAGLPYHISFNNRSYLNNAVCAGEGWCRDYKPECRTEEYFVENNQWPLKQVGEVPTLFGPAHPIMVPAAYSDGGTTGVYVPYGDGCYLNFGLEGGL